MGNLKTIYSVKKRYFPVPLPNFRTANGADFYNLIKYEIENDPHWYPRAFSTWTFYPSHSATQDLQEACKRWRVFHTKVAHRWKTHTKPLAFIGRGERAPNAWHIHEILLLPKNKVISNLDQIRECWWRGGNGIHNKIYKYDSSKGAVIYSANHSHYIPVDQPFCYRPKSCRPKCRKAHHIDIVRKILKAEVRGSLFETRKNQSPDGASVMGAACY